MRFRDRAEAGAQLGAALAKYGGRDDVVVLGLPRGGVPVAWEVAKRLDAPLDAFLVRKLGVPGHPELAMGAIASGGIRVVNDQVVRELAITEDALAAVATDEQQELERRERAYRGDRPELRLEGRTVILVDDGLATGSTMRAAAAAVGALGPERVVVAVPVAAPATCELLAPEVDEIVCLRTPEPFRAVGLWYRHFDQTTDEEVTTLLRRAERELPRRAASGEGAG